MEDLKNLSVQIDELLKSTNIEDVSSEGSREFKDLPEGYYLCEVEKNELTESKSSGAPMISFRFKVVENGVSSDIDDKGNQYLKEVKDSKNRLIFKYYPLKDEKTLKQFVSDMLKFEGETEGESLLPKEAFTTSEVLLDALDVLVGRRVYVQISITEDNNTGIKSSWTNLISWKRARVLELPM